MKILILEPFFTGSHKAWALAYQQHSQHNVEIFSLKGKYWKWRMHGGAVALAKKYLDSEFDPDLLLVTDMLDLTTFLSLTRKKTANKKVAIYFHENQLTYPWSPNDADVKTGRDNHYAFINYVSALTADQIYFNSAYHLNSFLDALPDFLQQFPDLNGFENIELIRQKSRVLSLALDLPRTTVLEKSENEIPVLLWNHRWEYDKNPSLFFKTLFRIKEAGIPFQLIVLGKAYAKSPAIFEVAKKKLKREIIHFGFAENEATYQQLLTKANILPVTSVQDFFGISVIEAIHAGCFPLLPNRLAYPQHIPQSLKTKLLYNSDSEFYQQLKDLLTNPVDKSELATVQNFVQQYDWRTLAAVYDKTFFELV